MLTYVFTKTGAASVQVTQALTLQPGESIVSVTPGHATPHDGSLFGVSVISGTANPLVANMTGGKPGMTYGVPIEIRTNQRVLTITFACACINADFDPYANQEPDSYKDLVGELTAGKSALASAVFTVAPDFDPAGGYVVWDIIAPDGVIHASGNAFEYRVTSIGTANVVRARCVVNVPSGIPPTVDEPYELRYTLRVGTGVAYSYESLRVHGVADVPVGTADAAELAGDTVTLSLVTEALYQMYAVELYAGNELLASTPVVDPDRVSSGYYVAGSFSTAQLPVSLVPYSVIWKYGNNPNQIFRESAALWIVNPSIAQAIEDVKSKVNKARQTLFGTRDTQYSSTEVLKWLRRGMDSFNNAYGVFTSFSMTNAMGGVREFWLLCAEKAALEAQYGLEGEKSFNYSGAAISLDVDRTAYIDSMIGKIQSELDSQLKPFKQNLVIKGNTGGDGSGPLGDGNFGVLQRSALGSVGITISPASIYNAGHWPRGFIR